MGNYTETPRQRRHARTKAAILEAARQIIAEEGPDALSMRGLAHRIDYSPAGLYEYFGSKEEIIAAVCQAGNQRLWQYMNRVDSTLPPEDYLLELGLAYIAFALQNPELFLLMFSTLPDSGGTRSPEEVMNSDSSYGLLLRALQNGIGAGVFRTRPEYALNEMGYNAWALVHGMAMLRLTHLQAYEADFDVADRQSLVTFIRGLMA